MKNLYLLLSFLYIGIQTFGQNQLRTEENLQIIKKSETVSTYISTYPITNRTYLVYLLWTMDNIGVDYPSKVIEIIPHYTGEVTNQSLTEFYESENKFEYISQHSDSIVKNYVLNPKYIDYPVVGLNKSQVFKFNKWLTDRFNEYLLIQNGFYEFNPNQVSNDYFDTQAYIVGQYFGRQLTDTTLDWGYDKFAPLLRLPTQNELKKVSPVNWKDFNKKNSSLNFIKPWTDYYVNKVKDDSIVINDSVSFLSPNELKIIKPSKNLIINNANLKELSFGESLNKSYQEDGIIYSSYSPMQDYRKSYPNGIDYPEKNHIGQMDFLIVGMDSNSVVMVIPNEMNSELDSISYENTYFRFAIDVRKK